eukprot:TRINITY_DN17217_c0_g1_i1.p1 TRINITY_DN17217_c0_g1~~TRINITY_DN17217_c0_g1_i1.p1  ORF type:complete len:192 (+),score=52.87 TRINITY_DN17217_c0_g1_i1:57-632(+)
MIAPDPAAVALAEPASRWLVDLLRQQRGVAGGDDPRGLCFGSSCVKPRGTVREYVVQLAQRTHCSRGSLVACLVYVERLVERSPTFVLSEANVRVLCLTCLVLAMKFFEEACHCNRYLAKVGGVTTEELNKLEKALLALPHFDLMISEDCYRKLDATLGTLAAPASRAGGPCCVEATSAPAQPVGAEVLVH